MFKLIFRDFRETNVSVESVDTISVLWMARGESLGRSHSNPNLIAGVNPVLKSKSLYRKKLENVYPSNIVEHILTTEYSSYLYLYIGR
jgi:hypothetical protein